MIVISSNLTFNPMLGQIYSFQNPNLQNIAPPNQALRNEMPNFNQNQTEHFKPQTSLANPGNGISNEIAVIYTLTNENGTTLIIKY